MAGLTRIKSDGIGDGCDLDGEGTLVLDSTNNRVGVGTSSPGRTLDVSGSIRSGGSTNPFIALNNETTEAYFEISGSETRISSGTSQPLLFRTGSDERMRITSSGNVGIGTTNPGAKLEVKATSTPVIRLNQNDTYYAPIKLAGNDLEIRGSSGTIEFYNGADNGETSTEKMRIDSSGRLLLNGGTDVRIELGTTGTTGTNDRNHLRGDGANLKYNTASSGVHVFEQNGTERMRIDSSGNVGIGTTSANRKLVAEQANSTAYSSSDFDQDYHLLKLRNITDDKSAGLQFSIGSNGEAAITATEVSDGAVDLCFGTRGGGSRAERMRITNGGYFKAAHDGGYFGATGTWHEFTGTTPNGYSFRAICDNGSPASHYISEFKFSTATPNNGDAKFLQCRDGSGARINLDSDGGIHNYQSNDGNLCDEREKKNIVSLDTKWDKVKSWELKKFHYNEDADTDNLRYGVIAQQVEEHCPEVLTDWLKQRAEDAVLDEDGNVVTPAVPEILRKGVKEQQMMWMAIKALQEAMERIETLEAEVAALKSN